MATEVTSPLVTMEADALDPGPDADQFERAVAASLDAQFAWVEGDTVGLTATVVEVIGLRNVLWDGDVQGSCGEVMIRVQTADGKLDVTVPAEVQLPVDEPGADLVLPGGSMKALRAWQVRRDCALDAEDCPDQAFEPLGTFASPEPVLMDWFCFDPE